MTEQVSYAASPGRVMDIAADIRAGIRSPMDVVQACLDRIADVDAHVNAWVLVDSAGALATAAEMNREANDGMLRGPLHGVPVAIKDICDVAGWPTRCNSRTRADAPLATADAEIVTALRTAGAIIIGKTHTTEFAYYDPSPARNPHNIDHTPGGSSSGSGAAVGAGMVPAAIGTQTVASVNRPAAYCGISAFKPSTRSMATYGIAPLAPLYDTPGVYGWSVADACYVFDAVRPPHGQTGNGLEEQVRVVVINDPFLGEAANEIIAARDDVADRLREAGHEVVEMDSPISLEDLNELQGHTTVYELARVHAGLLEVPENQVGAVLRQAVIDGNEIDDDIYQAERRRIDAMRVALLDVLRPADLVLWPAVPETAPAGLEWTGDRRYIAPWTAIGGPVVSMPSGFGAGDMPIGMLLVGSPGCDRYVSRVAPRLAEALPQAG
ncbi:MAG: peptide amidase [Alphaproteobacteria bacterium]|nr:peptide amidase [Alphaproteobacteria bacterium]HCP00236.1 amidase [Rhodospirillaceae bacterium]